jgi:hypothetical protein
VRLGRALCGRGNLGVAWPDRITYFDGHSHRHADAYDNDHAYDNDYAHGDIDPYDDPHNHGSHADATDRRAGGGGPLRGRAQELA